MTPHEKNPAAVAMGRIGGRANAAKHGRDHFVAIGRMGGAKGGVIGGARVKAAFAALALVDELRALGLMPSDAAIEAARRARAA